MRTVEAIEKDLFKMALVHGDPSAECNEYKRYPVIVLHWFSELNEELAKAKEVE